MKYESEFRAEVKKYFDYQWEYPTAKWIVCFTRELLNKIEENPPKIVRSILSEFSREQWGFVAYTLDNWIWGSQKPAQYWRKEILPFWEKYWPKDFKYRTPKVSYHLAHVLLRTREEFPHAFETLKDWLIPFQTCDGLIVLLKHSELIRRFPETALLYLKPIISSNCHLTTGNLEECLEQIKQAKPELENSTAFHYLSDLKNSKR